MKIHICADMEGTCGVYSWMQVTPPETPWGGPIKEAEYDRCRSRMTAEVSAAARGALSNGATEILVNDFHGGNRNIFIDELDDRCRLVSGGAGPMNFLQGMTHGDEGLVLHRISFESRHGLVGAVAHLEHQSERSAHRGRIDRRIRVDRLLRRCARCAGAAGDRRSDRLRPDRGVSETTSRRKPWSKKAFRRQARSACIRGGHNSSSRKRLPRRWG